MSNYRESLPQYEGPKLHPFPDQNPAIGFKRLLSDVEAGGHAQRL